MKKTSCYALFLGVAFLFTRANAQSGDSLEAVSWLKAHNIALNDPKAPDGYQRLRDCNADIVYKKVSGDTIIYYYTQSYFARPVGYLEYIQNRPYFNVTVYPKSVQPDGTVVMIETAFHAFLLRNDSLYALDKTGSTGNSILKRLLDNAESMKKQMDDSGRNFLEAMLYERMQYEDTAAIRNFRGMESLFSGNLTPGFQLIYYKDMFKDRTSCMLKKDRARYETDTATGLTITMEKKLKQDGRDCYLVSIQDRDWNSTLDLPNELLLSDDGRLLDLENCRLNKKELLASLQSVKDSLAQKSVDSLFRTRKMANASGGNIDKPGFATPPFAEVEMFHRKGVIDKHGNVAIPVKYDQLRIVTNGLAVVFAAQKARFMDFTGREVSSVAYDDYMGYSRGLAAVKMNNKIGFVDKNANEVIPCIYDEVEMTYGGWLVKLRGRQGLLDTTGKEVIPLKYDNIIRASRTESYYVRSGSKAGLVDRNGREVIPLLYEGLEEFSEGAAMVMKNGKLGFIDSAGKEIIPLMYDVPSFYKRSQNFDGGRAKVFLAGKCGYINKQNKAVIPFTFDEISEFDEDSQAVAAKNGLYGSIDRLGNTVIPFTYELSFRFSEHYAVVDVNGLEGVIDRTGKQIVPARYTKIKVNESGDWIRVEWNEKYGFYNTRGQLIVPVRYTNRTSKYTIENGFSEGLVAVEENGKWGYLDHNGKLAIPMKFDEAQDFKGGEARVVLNGKYGYINRTGRELIPAKYTDIRDFYEGWAAASLDGKWGFIDKKGKTMIPFAYEDVSNFYGGLSAVKIHDKYGYIDKDGNVVIPCMYDAAGNFY